MTEFSEQNRRILFLVLAGTVVAAVCLSNFFVFNADDLSIKYSDNPEMALWYTNFSNYRYVIAGLSLVMDWLRVSYYSNALALIVLFSGGLLYCCVEFCRYVKFPPLTAVFFFLAVAFHGFMADIYPFTMGYWNYGIAWAAIGAALYALRAWTPLAGVAAATVLGAVTLMTYQPIALLLLIAAGLACVRDSLLAADGARRTVLELARPVVCFALACVIFLVAKAVWGPEGGRPVSLSAAASNIGSYLANIPDQFLSLRGKYSALFPRHERVIYGVVLLAMFGLLLWNAVRGRSVYAALAVLAFAAAVLVAANPFNLPSPTFWPTPRSMAIVAFLHAGVLVLLLLYLSEVRRTGASGQIFIAAVFVFLSINNQVGLFVERERQMQADIAMAQGIVDDLKARGLLVPDGKLAVVASWQNPAQLNQVLMMDFGLSGFSTAWSRIPLLRAVSGVRLQEVAVPKEACETQGSRWVIVQTEAAPVVCMR